MQEHQSSSISGKYIQVPLLFVMLAFTIMVAFQALQLWQERERLTATLSALEQPFQDAGLVRDQFESVANGTATLARSGNDNAAAILAELNRAGVTIR